MKIDYTKLRKTLEAKIAADTEVPVSFSWIGRFKNGSGATGIKFKWAKLKAEAAGYRTKVYTVYVNERGQWHTT